MCGKTADPQLLADMDPILKAKGYEIKYTRVDQMDGSDYEYTRITLRRQLGDKK